MPALEMDYFIDRFAFADTLEVHYVQSDHLLSSSSSCASTDFFANLIEEKARKSWEFLINFVKSLALENKLGLNRLILNSGRGDILTTFTLTDDNATNDGPNSNSDSLTKSPLLKVLGSKHLTKLEFKKMQFGQIQLNSLFKSCPSLIELFIEYDPLSEHVEWSEESAKEQGFKQLQLKSLVMYNARMKQSSLEGFLRRCTILKTLEIVFLRITASTPTESSSSNPPADPFEGIAFFKNLKSSCSKLTNLQFSLANRSLSLEEYMMIVDNFITLTTFGAAGKDFTCRVIGPRILEHYANNITTLELHSSSVQPSGADGEPGKIDVEALHNFLCSSPSLLHLRAKGVVYSSRRFMDFTGYRRRLGQDQVWACNDLLTLQLSFLEPTMREDWSESNSRILFGYISRVCPKLKELWIYRPFISLLLEGGLCLLTRCRDLECLTIKTGRLRGKASSQLVSMHDEIRPEMIDVYWIEDWIGNRPSLFTRRKRKSRYSELIKRTLKHEHQWYKRQDDICEACNTKNIQARNENNEDSAVLRQLATTLVPRSPQSVRICSDVSEMSSHDNSDDPNRPALLPSFTVDALCRTGMLQEVISWMEEEPGWFSNPSYICWPKLRAFKLGIHVEHTHKTIWAWRNSSAVVVQKELRPDIGFEVKLTTSEVGLFERWAKSKR
ncbi:hypothetical protein BGZ76_009561 [Entomortierella beljakovae]|nr:hypothetical protein BGZ76_009561 [Entomortierella beljakovae]